MNLLKIFEYIVLGLLQGFTEPIPVSSSGHLVIIKNLIKLNTLKDINFEIIVNFGSFIAIFYLYRKEIIKIISDFFMYIKTKKSDFKENYNYAWLIVIGTIPACIFGLIFKDKIDLISGNVKLVGLALLITSLALFLIRDIKGKKNKKDITVIDSIVIGLFQTVALLPGISRSGATIVGSMFRDLKRDAALKYSFMLYLPISLATLVLGVKDLIKTPNLSELIIPYTIGLIASMVVTYFSAKWFINIMKKGKLIYFSIYCLIVGLLVLIFM